MEFKDLMVTIPLSVYTEMVTKLAVQDIAEKKETEISELTKNFKSEIADREEEVTYYRNMWYEEHKKVQALEERKDENA